jgi:hypothetical protein
MNDLFKNPFLAFIAGLLALWLIFYLLKFTINFFWIFPLAFVILFITNERFRDTVKTFFSNLFNRS